MYARRLQITNYGPIEQLDITFPFDEQGRPKPVVLVGENGSGKSILLSHIVNGLIAAKDFAYDGSPEVNSGKVYKLRSNLYIKDDGDFYFARFDFADGLFSSELRLAQPKADGVSVLPEIAGTDAQVLWDKMEAGEHDGLHLSWSTSPSMPTQRGRLVRASLDHHCVLYFPSNRFDEPAWLNSDHLTGRATLSEPGTLLEGETARQVIASAPLHTNRDWLFDIIFDYTAFEARAAVRPLHDDDGNVTGARPMLEYRGQTTAIYGIALALIRRISGLENVKFGIGNRQSRLVSLYVGDKQIVPNIFQLSSGEVSLLNLFLSILRDYDACGVPFSGTAEVRGIVVVDEIDLHLHVRHQHDVLPSLIAMFPNVQFVVTTHSPLFVLGMSSVFGDDGFDLRRLPDGEQIDPEEFREFGNAYQAFAETRRHAAEVRLAIEQANTPVIYLEGSTDVKYVRRSAELLGRLNVLNGAEVSSAGGERKLKGIWTALDPALAQRIGQKVVLVADCDSGSPNADKGRVFWRRIAKVEANPVERGIENLFAKETLERAREHDSKFFAEVGHGEKELPDRRTVFDRWVVKKERKVDLCDWLCRNGTAEDFKGFEDVLNILEEVLQSEHQDEGAPH